jgi:acyl-CoA reductase-like NAD-dependent aldehyde dehydrogenase
MAGNTVILKHATQTLLVGERLVRGLPRGRRAGGPVPEPGPRPRAPRGADLGGGFDFINFTGSVGGGQAIERAAAGTFTPSASELGGKDPRLCPPTMPISTGRSTR